MAAIYNWLIEQNSDESLRVDYYLDDNPGTPIDLTGYRARLWFKRSKELAKVDFKLNSLLPYNSSTLTVDGPSGAVNVFISYKMASQMSGEYYYDLIVENGINQIQLIKGVATVSTTVTV